MAWPTGGMAHNNWDRAGGVPTDFRSFANAHMPHGHDGIGGMYEQMMGLHDNKNDEMEQIKWLGEKPFGQSPPRASRIRLQLVRA